MGRPEELPAVRVAALELRGHLGLPLELVAVGSRPAKPREQLDPRDALRFVEVLDLHGLGRDLDAEPQLAGLGAFGAEQVEQGAVQRLPRDVRGPVTEVVVERLEAARAAVVERGRLPLDHPSDLGLVVERGLVGEMSGPRHGEAGDEQEDDAERAHRAFGRMGQRSIPREVAARTRRPEDAITRSCRRP